MKTTLREIKKFSPCKDEAKKFLDKCKIPYIWECNDALEINENDLDREIDIKQILQVSGIKSAVWALRTQKYEDHCLFLADVAELALPIFEKKHPKDIRPRKAIKAIRQYKKGDISIDDLATYAYADVYTANAAAYTYAANAVAYAIAVAFDVAIAVDDIAFAVAAAYVADDGGGDDARKKVWQKIEKLLLKYL
jgi:hypothetical protein